MIFASTVKNKEKFQRSTKLWDDIKNQVETITGGKSIDYEKDFMKMRFESDDNLPLGKILGIPVMVITASVFKKGTSIIHKFFYMNVCINL